MTIKIEAANRLQAAFNPKVYNWYLSDYLEGEEDIPAWWITEVLHERSKSPSTVYRLSLVSKNETIGIGTKLRLEDKPIMSVSDKVVNAVYAGCSYHSDLNTPLTNKQIVLLAIRNPTCLISFAQLVRYYKGLDSSRSSYYYSRCLKEREYLIKGTGITGEVMFFTQDTSFISKGAYQALRKQVESNQGLRLPL